MQYHIDFDLDFRRNPYPGKFIAIEGIDGCGKTTQAHLLAEKLAKSHKVSLTKNPTSSPVGQLAEKVIKKQIDIPAVALQYLFTADRHIHQVGVEKDLKAGKIVVTDRYFWSSVAYGLADKDEVDYDKNANLLLVAYSALSMYAQFIVPDLTVYLEVPVKIALTRLAKMHRFKEYYERQEKLTKAQKGYQWLIKKFPKEIKVIDGTKTKEKITEEILKNIENLKFKI